MIITVTMNPAIDKTARVERLTLRGLNRLSDVRWDIGGKGINVSKTLNALGTGSIATGFLAGQTGAAIRAELECIPDVTADFIEIPGQTRTNLKLVEPDGSLTELNEQGPAVLEDALTQLKEKLGHFARPGNLFVLSGSVGPGVPTDFYATVTDIAHAGGAKVLLDADGTLFARGLETKPDIIKPNEWELCRLFGCDDTSEDGLIAMGRELNRRGVETVCISRGAKGALLVRENQICRFGGLPVPVRSAVGAGDAMVAALAMGFETGLSPQDGFRLACAAGAAACMTEGTTPPDMKIVKTLEARVLLDAVQSK